MVNTHSPYYVRFDAYGEGRNNVLAAMATTTKRDGHLATTIRLRPIVDTWRTKKIKIDGVAVEALADYLRTPENALVLPWNEDR